MPEADESDTRAHGQAEEWLRSIRNREEIADSQDAPAQIRDHAAARYWTLPQAMGWIRSRDENALSSFAAPNGWKQVRRERDYDHPRSPGWRPGALMSIGEAWRELHGALVASRIAAFSTDGAQRSPAYWGHHLSLPVGNNAIVASAEVRGLWPAPSETPAGASADRAVAEPKTTEGRPSNRVAIRAALDALHRDGRRVHDMARTQLAGLVAERCGAKLDDPGWNRRTVLAHIQSWCIGG